MKNKIRNTIEKYNMPVKNARVIVALSGGSDSMSLLHALYSLRDEYGFTLEAAHVNHGIRGESAQRDEHFSVHECEKLGIECHVLRADVPSIASDSGMSVEEAGRKVRYDFFASLGDDAVIATAHNLNDRIETMLFNLARGSSLKGLWSIPPVRGNVVRPLIDCTKEEILDYCSKNGIDYVNDETNDDIHYTRNRIRHNVLTQLKAVNPAFERSALRCIECINDDEAFLLSLAEETAAKARTDGGYSTRILAGAPLPVLRRAVNMIVNSFLPDSSDNRLIDEVVSCIAEYESNGKGKTVQLKEGRFLRTRAGLLEFPEKAETCDVCRNMQSGAFSVSLQTVSRDEYNLRIVNKNLCDCFIDSDKITGEIKVRTRLEGDRITPAGRGVGKQLRKLQNELGIPPELRDIAPVICDDEGIVAAYPCCVDERVKVTAGTETVLAIRIEKEGSYNV